MIYHENRLLADDSHVTSYLFLNNERCHKFVVCCSCDWSFKGQVLSAYAQMPLIHVHADGSSKLEV